MDFSVTLVVGLWMDLYTISCDPNTATAFRMVFHLSFFFLLILRCRKYTTEYPIFTGFLTAEKIWAHPFEDLTDQIPEI